MTEEQFLRGKQLIDDIERSESRIKTWERKKNEFIYVQDCKLGVTTSNKILNICINEEKQHLANLKHSFSLL